MLFHFKPGTAVEVLTSDLLLGLLGLAHIMETVIGTKAITITSVNDGVHKTGSLHYNGNAVDIRSRVYPQDQVHECVRLFRASPDGARYDLLFESPGTSNEHLHLEFDPEHRNG